MVGVSFHLPYRFYHGVTVKEIVLDNPLIREPNGQALQRVDGRSVRRFRMEEPQLVELVDNPRGGLAVASPRLG